MNEEEVSELEFSSIDIDCGDGKLDAESSNSVDLVSEQHEPHVVFFQAEDGIRPLIVTGVQTCALPISRLQSSRDYRLSDPVRHGRHPQHPDATTMRFRDLHRPHRRRKIRTRTHPVPDLIQIPFQVLLEILDRAPIHPRRTLISPDLLPRPLNLPLRNLKRLVRQLLLHPPNSSRKHSRLTE